MNTLQYVLRVVIPGALELLPPRMDTPAARALLLAIALQESGGLKHRRQMARGPARSFWQGEITGGMILVLDHEATEEYAHAVLELLVYPTSGKGRDQRVWEAIEHNDVLACALARLLLWSS